MIGNSLYEQRSYSGTFGCVDLGLLICSTGTTVKCTKASIWRAIQIWIRNSVDEGTVFVVVSTSSLDHQNSLCFHFLNVSFDGWCVAEHWCVAGGWSTGTVVGRKRTERTKRKTNGRPFQTWKIIRFQNHNETMMKEWCPGSFLLCLISLAALFCIVICRDEDVSYGIDVVSTVIPT